MPSYYGKFVETIPHILVCYYYLFIFFLDGRQLQKYSKLTPSYFGPVKKKKIVLHKIIEILVYLVFGAVKICKLFFSKGTMLLTSISNHTNYNAP
jgi:hypothetical protein